MRLRMVRALCTIASFAFFSIPSGAQSKPGTEQTGPSITRGPILVCKLSKDQKTIAENDGLPCESLPIPLTDAAPLKTFVISRQGDAEVEPPPSCAHILIYAAPPNSDTKMIIEAPSEVFGTMPAFKSLPPCSRDFRTKVVLPQGPFVWLRPLRNDSTLPQLWKRFAPAPTTHPDAEKPQKPVPPR